MTIEMIIVLALVAMLLEGAIETIFAPKSRKK